MASLEKELEDQLIEAGDRILKPPSSVEELLPLLDQVESCLLRVEQSPSKSMQNALCSSMKALVANELLRHLDMDVKVSVAACISEITRITAPDAPYDDEQMKEIFQLIVAAFEKLFDTSSRSYSKRVSILETVAKVRSCVVMLDLECDALILEMFQHFLKAVRDFHPDNVFSSMETIMTLVLEESEDISPELLSPLLSSVKKENQDVLPIARKLGEKVLENCTVKLKPYLMQAVQSMGMSLNDYSKIVASICQGTSDTINHNDVNASGQHLADESRLSERTGSDEPKVAEEMEPEAACPGEVEPVVDKAPKFGMSNGIAQTANDDSLLSLDSPKKKAEHSRHTTQSAKSEPDSLEPSKMVKSETKPDEASKRKRGRKSNYSMHSTEASGHSQIDSDKEAVELPDRRKSRSKEASNSLSEDLSINEATVPSEHEKDSQTQISLPTTSHNETVNVASPSPSQSVPDGSRPKRGRRGPKKKGNINQDTGPGSPSLTKGALLSDQIEDEAPPSADVISKKESEGNSDSEAKPHRRSGKKALTGKASVDRTPPSADVISKKGSGATSDSEAKPLKRSGKKVDVRDTNEEGSSKMRGSKTKRGRGKAISDKDVIGDGSDKKIVSSPKATAKSIDKDQSPLEETPKTKAKRKRTPGKEETSDAQQSGEDPGENLVGSKIKVWWPRDQMFYEGVVESFDHVRKKHKVLYVDGDVETLMLKKETWELVEGGDTVPDGKGQATDLPSPDASSEKPQKKRAKTSSDSPTMLAKTDASVKRGEGASARKSKGEVSKSGGKSKDDGKLRSKSKDNTPKTNSKSRDDNGGKSKDDTPKASSKMKDDTHKPGSKSKDDSSKSGTKLKGETPKTGSKSSANGTSAKGKSGSSKVQGSEDLAKGKLLDSAKARESETKSGKKRRRRVDG